MPQHSEATLIGADADRGARLRIPLFPAIGAISAELAAVTDPIRVDEHLVDRLG